MFTAYINEVMYPKFWEKFKYVHLLRIDNSFAPAPKKQDSEIQSLVN